MVLLIVQIEKDVDHPGLRDWLRECVARMLTITSPGGSRQLMVLKLILPTMVLGVLHYMISSLARYNVVALMNNEIQEEKVRLCCAF